LHEEPHPADHGEAGPARHSRACFAAGTLREEEAVSRWVVRRGTRFRLIVAGAFIGIGSWLSVPTANATTGTTGVIAFQSDRVLFDQIYTMNADGSNVKALLKMDAAIVTPASFDPAWSPDGTKFALAACCPNGNFDVYGANADGSDLHLLAGGASRDTSPAWSPDGGTIVFVSNRDGNFDLYLMNADGSNVRNLTNNSANNCGCFAPFNLFAQPSFSPDGTKVAFSSDVEDRLHNLDVYVINVDGTGLTRLTTNAAVDGEPDWSPDGKRIAFESDRDGDFEIFSMRADGTGVKKLTSNSALDLDPDWSPDGSMFGFVSDRDAGNVDIYLMNADGTAQTRITNDPGIDERPDWRPVP
jgi:Tol biopolymer transport system component